MHVKIANIKILADENIDLEKYLIRKYKIEDMTDFEIQKRSIDARDKTKVFLIYTVTFKTNQPGILKIKDSSIYLPIQEMKYPTWQGTDRPVVIGFGPSGMFCALYLARCNAKPIVIERGSKVENRMREVQKFYEEKKLNPNSNVLFGEGGAGTFSDGKLTTNLNNPLIQHILRDFHKFGASKEILYDAMPHIGSDVLKEVVRNLRREILSLGGEVYFDTVFTRYEEGSDELLIHTTNGDFSTKHLFLGLGHSAVDTITMLYNKGFAMEPKGFSVGVRVEHSAEAINKMQYGRFAKALPPAYYKTAVHLAERNVYTFCMCPGGYVMASTNEEGHIVTNGMSNSKRDALNSNAALLVEIQPKDYYVNSPLDGFDYQSIIEQNAFLISKDYRAPANLMREFIQKKVATEVRSVQPTYPHGICFTKLEQTLPSYVCDALREAILKIDKRMPGFYEPDAVITGVETRSSSPVRILRDESLQAKKMVYPIGEGAGYAGGITSSALDGLKAAIQCVESTIKI